MGSPSPVFRIGGVLSRFVTEAKPQSAAPSSDAEEVVVRRLLSATPLVAAVAMSLSLLVLLAEVTVVETLRFRSIVLGLALALSFLTLKPTGRLGRLIPYGLAFLVLGVSLAVAAGGREFLFRFYIPPTLRPRVTLRPRAGAN